MQAASTRADVDERSTTFGARRDKPSMPAHGAPLNALLQELRVDAATGLPAEEVAARLASGGRNELRKAAPVSPLAILVAQFRSLVVWILIGAAAVSAALGEFVDGAAIITIVLLNGLFGFYQEYRAERAAAALARLVAPRARVLRGESVMLDAAEVVPGDILLLEAGDLVAADARLVEAHQLRTNEAPLTGESEPVSKEVGTLSPETPLADRANMVFLGSSIATGTARALVTATGMRTEMGNIAGLLESAQSGETPLQRRLDRVGRYLLWVCLGIVVVIFILGLIRSIAPFELFLGSVSLAVAAIPEGLPAVVTVALALGMQRMARRSALVKHLPAVETLGCAQVICTDKTGTLTVGEMTVRRIVTAATVYSVTGEGYATAGAFLGHAPAAVPERDPQLRAVLTAAAACNDAELAASGGRAGIIGDPTEGALLVAAAKLGIRREALERDLPRIDVVAFNSERRRMTVVRRREAGATAYVKGAPEIILDRCTHVLTARGVEPLSDAERWRLAGAGAGMASSALRVLAVAERDAAAERQGDPERLESGLTLLGLVGLQDPPRPEVYDAIAKCRRAGIRVVMITGDHPDTAAAIARELGILGPDDAVLPGAELAGVDDASLAGRVHRVAVYARVTAGDKLRIVRAWKARGMVVAMTGDGVNDAPALKEASIGVAMGIAGTEVTKQAADIVIADDNFASIVAAVEEGRGIYDNISKTLSYLLAGNAAELAVMLIAGLIGWPLPLLPIHLLWINLVTDGLPALALAADPVDRDVLSRPPRRQQAELIDSEFVKLIGLTAALTAGVTLAAFALEYYASGDLGGARDAAFTVLVFSELFRAFGARSRTVPIWRLGVLSNIRLFAVVLVSFSFQLLIHHVPALRPVFGIDAITLTECAGWIVLGVIPLAVIEIRKVLRDSIDTVRATDVAEEHAG